MAALLPVLKRKQTLVGPIEEESSSFGSCFGDAGKGQAGGSNGRQEASESLFLKMKMVCTPVHTEKRRKRTMSWLRRHRRWHITKVERARQLELENRASDQDARKLLAGGKAETWEVM